MKRGLGQGEGESQGQRGVEIYTVHPITDNIALVSRHRYYEYEPSSESDNEDDSIYTGEKGVQACRSVNRQMSADKSDNTLRRLNPGKSGNGVKQQRLQNNWPNKEFEPSPPLQSNSGKSVQNVSLDIAADLPLNQFRHDSNNSQLNGRTDSTERASQVIPADESQIAAVFQNLPSTDPSNQNAVVVHSECQQKQHTPADMSAADDQRQIAASVQDAMPVCVSQGGKYCVKLHPSIQGHRHLR